MREKKGDMVFKHISNTSELCVFGETEVEADVEFFLEEVGAALGIAKIFGDVAACLNLKSDGTPLKGRVQALNPLAMRMIQAFCDANDGSQATGQALVVAIQGGVGRMVTGRLRLSIVVSDNGANDVAVSPVEAGNVAIQGEIFTVFVVPTMAHPVPHIMQ
jgi:hypothetical protein